MTEQLFRLDGDVAIVTGAGAGLGHAIAVMLAKAGARVVAADMDGQQAQRTATVIAEQGGRAVAVTADVADPASVGAMLEAALAQFGHVDILVNNAVVRNPGSAEELSTPDWDDALAVNLSSSFHTARLALPSMRKAGWGRIINISSVYGLTATTGRIAYITTKTALIGLTRAIAMDSASAGITCNALCPGTLPTPPILAKIEGIAASKGISVTEAQREYISTRHPTGRFVAMENVGAFASFLCSDAGSDITGAVLPMDAGWTIE